jgi:hypothetical protein
MFDWGDDTHSQWLGPYNSGETCIAEHTYTEQGQYRVKAKSKDVHGIQSTWRQSEKNNGKNIVLEKLFHGYPVIYNIINKIMSMVHLYEDRL